MLENVGDVRGVEKEEVREEKSTQRDAHTQSQPIADRHVSWIALIFGLVTRVLSFWSKKNPG